MSVGQIGLCAQCIHHSIITSGRGKEFHLCNKSTRDKSFAKYPKLPVIQCRGYKALLETTKKD